MKRFAITFAILSFLGGAFPHFALGQEAAAVAGTWDVTINIPGQKVSEQWMIQPDGDNLTATIKGANGEMKVPCELNGINFRSDFKDSGGAVVKVRAGVGGDRMDGSIAIGDKEYLWFAKRAKT